MFALRAAADVDIHAIGLQVTKGDLILISFSEDVSLRFSDEFYRRRNCHAFADPDRRLFRGAPAVRDIDIDDPAKVMARMKETPVSNAYTSAGKIREDQRMVHDLYLVKSPEDQAFRPLNRSKCNLVNIAPQRAHNVDPGQYE